MDIFESKDIAPMLISESKAPFNDDNYIYELKLDGIRCIVYLDENTLELRNKRNKNVTSIYPELEGVNKQVKKRCILDGEILILNEGKPYFSELQRRSLMTNPFKIKLAAGKLPVCFTAFDILYFEDKQITDLSLLQRKEILFSNVLETPKLALSRHIEGNGIALFELTKQQELEGIIAKNKDSKYYLGKRTKDWVKCKALLDEDFVVCGYYLKSDNITSIILGSYKDNTLTYQSHVAMGVSRFDFSIISSTGRVTKDRHYYNFPDFEDVVWIEPKNVCTVKFMERTTNGGLRQPVFKGLRDDKEPKECKVEY